MNYFFLLALILFGYMNCWFIVSLIKKRNDVADIAWGLGFVCITWSSFFISQNTNWRALLINILVTIWGTRLAAHIYLRNRQKSEDSRYQEWRNSWGRLFLLRSYFQVFLLQGALLFLISLPVLFTNYSTPTFFTLLDAIGVIVWVFGFFFEAVGDWQLGQFLADPAHKGKIMQSGLWQYSRHPNYFGEVTQWWGIYLLALADLNNWFTIISPITITLLILFVSGIPLLEKKYSQRADYQAYKKSTSIFIPLPKRSV